MLLLAPVMHDTVGEGVGVLFLATHVTLPRTTGPARLQAKIEIPCASFLPTDTATHAFLTSFMQTFFAIPLTPDFCSEGILCLLRFAGNALIFFQSAFQFLDLLESHTGCFVGIGALPLLAKKVFLAI